LTPRQAQRWTWAACGALVPAWYLLPRLWWDHAHWREEVGDLSGYASIVWMGLVALMPAAARFGGERGRKLLAIRKPFGVCGGLFILAHGAFTVAVPAGGNPTVLVTGGNAAGIQNFVAALFLVVFSIPAMERRLPARWRREHRRWLTLFILFSGAMSTMDSERVLLPPLVRAWAAFVFVARAGQLALDRRKIRRDRLATNLAWFAFPFGFSALAEFTQRADLLALGFGPLALGLLLWGMRR
jgi:DMSO/TMAO reductase YedYZ heme-binding membrane subunit